VPWRSQRGFKALLRHFPLLLPSADRRNDTFNRHCETRSVVAVPTSFEEIASVTYVPFCLRQTGAMTNTSVTLNYFRVSSIIVGL
jgi:hypothetical protein